MEDCTLKIVRLSSNATIPSKPYEDSAGFDLFAAHDCIVNSNDKALILTDIKISLPDDSYGRIAPRSGLALHNFLQVGGGVIDRNFRGNLGVIIFNHGSTDYKIKHKDRIAQLIIEKIFYPKLVEVDHLDHSDRNCNSFGSSGF